MQYIGIQQMGIACLSIPHEHVTAEMQVGHGTPVCMYLITSAHSRIATDEACLFILMYLITHQAPQTHGTWHSYGQYAATVYSMCLVLW